MPLSLSPDGDLGADHGGRLQACAAGLLMVTPGVVGATWCRARLAPPGSSLGVADDGSATASSICTPREAVLVDQPVQRCREHLRLDWSHRSVGAAEGDAHAADHRHAAAGLVQENSVGMGSDPTCTSINL